LVDVGNSVGKSVGGITVGNAVFGFVGLNVGKKAVGAGVESSVIGIKSSATKASSSIKVLG
jgi:hypothetical protein